MNLEFEQISNGFKIEAEQGESSFTDNRVFITSDNRHIGLIVSIRSLSAVDSNNKNLNILNNKNIKLLEYSSEINNFLISGTLTYIDNEGLIGKYFNKDDIWCEIHAAECTLKKDGDVMKYVIDNKLNFKHSFTINKISILEKHDHIITYRLYLIGTEWYYCMSNLAYSNYNNVDSFGYPIGEKPGDILLSLFSMAGKPILKEYIDSFSNICDTSLKIPFATGVNDNLIASYKYIMNKMYTLNSYLNESLVFLVYDYFKNSYKMINIKNEKSYLPNSFPHLLVQFSPPSSKQTLIDQFKNNLATVSNVSIIDIFKVISNNSTWTYDHRTNLYDSNEIPSSSILNIFNNSFDQLKDITTPKLHSLPDIYLNLDYPNISYSNNGTLWNEYFGIYDSLINILYKDALVVNITGRLSYQPGMIFYVGAGEAGDDSNEYDNKKYDSIKNKNKQIIGTWQSLRVRHMFYPANSPFKEDEGLPALKENIVLCRNFNRQIK